MSQKYKFRDHEMCCSSFVFFLIRWGKIRDNLLRLRSFLTSFCIKWRFRVVRRSVWKWLQPGNLCSTFSRLWCLIFHNLLKHKGCFSKLTFSPINHSRFSISNLGVYGVTLEKLDQLKLHHCIATSVTFNCKQHIFD